VLAQNSRLAASPIVIKIPQFNQGSIISGYPISPASPEILITQQFGQQHTSLSVSYYHFYRGGFLTENQPNTKDVDYFPTWLTYTF
jgi:hypothetical protein